MLLIGENAQGKTNFLEAIYILSYGTSFRTNKFDEIKTFQQNECSLSSTLVDEHQIKNTIHFRYKDNQKDIRINQNKILDRKEMIYYNPIIIFSYDDYKIIIGGHGERRNFFDQMQCFKSIHYVNTIRNYKKVLIQRNEFLKQKNIAILDTYNYQLAKYGLEIMKYRQQCIKECSERAQRLFHDVSSEKQKLEFSYHPSWNTSESIDSVVRALEQGRNDDLRNGYTGSGPHRDRIFFYVNGKNAATYASTGQIRCIALIIKAIQSMVVHSGVGKSPILLFDDVLLELDNKREKGILEQIPEAPQLFFTFLPHKETDLLRAKEVQKIRVENGTLSTR